MRFGDGSSGGWANNVWDASFAMRQHLPTVTSRERHYKAVRLLCGLDAEVSGLVNSNKVIEPRYHFVRLANPDDMEEIWEMIHGGPAAATDYPVEIR